QTTDQRPYQSPSAPTDATPKGRGRSSRLTPAARRPSRRRSRNARGSTDRAGSVTDRLNGRLVDQEEAATLVRLAEPDRTHGRTARAPTGSLSSDAA